ncbi:uncharacterized protein PITG_01618 [Phytophthora infestans T30-4]|uniref:Tudor domain-containing protein n=1 Tax=Phytophthora infestans (strain T30-4) TaxID=403677 RepID=D0MTN3_PHYIT|nr:uncharacterized protein PITG_01618 [Phytophthora infestans T30-4]EEY61330.1 conserved hypothetical protein [Phytophthora infestans T30-4]|eukprot:XP_002908247.1 conserved hypothetical protein [Phytophthora infestans T30-4]
MTEDDPTTPPMKRANMLSLNANAPGLMRSNSFTGPSSSHDEVQESLSLAIPDEEGTPFEINQLIGKPVERTVTKEGCGVDVVQGAVASYFPATKMFRVMYFDGECCDLSYHEVFNKSQRLECSISVAKAAKNS